MVQVAERRLNDGDPAAARDRMPEIERAVLGLEEKKGSDERAAFLRDRTDRIRALANVRLDDGASPHRERAWLAAVITLQRLADAHPGDAARQTDLAEALARTRPAEARPILEDLAGRDLLTTPYGYVALARLRAADGEVRGRDEALVRYRAMAKSTSICSRAR
jgi:hypothetical protein